MTIDVIGIGLDGVAGLTDKVRQLINHATILVGSDRHLSYFSNYPVQKLSLDDFFANLEYLKKQLLAGERLVIIASGDPLFFGLGRLLLEKLPAEELQFYPHFSAVQLAFNRIKVPWQDAKFFSAHGRSLEELAFLLQQGEAKIAILTDNNNSPRAISDLYQSLDLAIDYDIWVCEDLGGDREQIYHYPASQINQITTISEQKFSPLNVVVLLRQDQENSLAIEDLPCLGLPDSTFLSFPDRPGLMTKREIRLLVLGELALRPQQIVWDIGAGTGSVSIEIARICPTSTIYAIEKTAMGKTLIEKNCQRLQVNNVVPLQGNAPEILAQLPLPNRIFIGGSGGNLTEILTVCQEKLLPGGLVSLALATLENFQEGLAWFKDKTWNYHLLQLQISRSIPVGKLTRFSPLNPVTIITAYSPYP
jgi:precorrin-6Y C5,15-methyltransferase (decarboxylating)